MSDYKVGGTVFLVFRDQRPDKYSTMTVTKVGRKWVTCEVTEPCTQTYRFDKSEGLIENSSGSGYVDIGRAYPSVEAFEEWEDTQGMLQDIKKFMDINILCYALTRDQVKRIKDIIDEGVQS